jgi:predicted nucleotidyltransferase
VHGKTYPGSTEHQRLLRAIVEQYADDDRVLAVSVFGSIGRGTWDEHSDLDLDVVLADGVSVDAPVEMRRLCEAIGEQPVIAVRDRDADAYVVLASLMELSIRYHPLQTTKVNIVESLVVLGGRLSHAEIAEAGLRNPNPPPPTVADLVAAALRQVVTLEAKLHRRRFWLAYLLLHEARERLLRVYAASHGAQRPYHVLDAADPSLLDRLRRTVPGDDLPSIQRALVALLDLLEHDLGTLSAGQAQLTEAQCGIVAQLRARQARLDLRAE